MRHTFLLTLTLALSLGAPAQSPEALLRTAMDKETVDGDLKSAIEQYRKVLAKAGSNRSVAAEALVRLGICYERQGDADARRTYDRVLKEFADQPQAAALARNRLAGLGARSASSGLAVRQVWGDVDGSVRLWGRISPDGRYMTHVAWGNGDLAVRDLETGQSRLVTRFADGNKDGVEFSAWSRDGKRIAFSWETKDRWELRVINADGSGMKTIYTTKRQVDPLDWSADGKRVLAYDWARGGAVHLIWVNIADGSVQTLKSGNGIGASSVSPDGRVIAYREDNDIRAMAADGSNDGVAVSYNARQSPLNWSPDGKHLLITRVNGDDLSLWAIPMNGARRAAEPFLVRRDLGDRVRWLGSTQSGSIHFAQTVQNSDIHTVDLDPVTGKTTSQPQLLPLDRFGSNVNPRWSPDGRQLVYYWTKGLREISTYSFDTGKVRRLTQAPKSGVACWVGPNAIGHNLATGEQTSSWTRIDLATSALAPLHAWSGQKLGRNCDASGEHVVTSDLNGVYVLNVRSGVEKRVYQFQGRRIFSIPSLSPDGSHVAFEIEAGVLVVVNTASGEAREIVRVQFPAELQRLQGISWSPDSRQVFYVKKTAGNAPWGLYRISIAGGAEENCGLKLPGLVGIAVSPDGKRLAFASGGSQLQVWAVENPLAGRP